MGLYHSLYLCAGIKIPNQYTTWIDKQRTCGEHVNYSNDKFCSKCGKEIIEAKVERKSLVATEDLIGSDRLVAYHPENDEGHTYLLSNVGAGEVKGLESNMIVKIDGNLIASLKAEFIDEHAEDIRMLEEAVGRQLDVDFFFLDDYS